MAVRRRQSHRSGAYTQLISTKKTLADIVLAVTGIIVKKLRGLIV